MDWPALLPSQLDYCLHLRGEEQIISALTAHSDEHLVWFIEVASDDETWCVEHRDFMTSLLDWVTNEFSSKRLRVDLGQRVGGAIHRHSKILLPMLPRDLQFRLNGDYPMGNSLLWGIASPFFLGLIETRYKKGKIIEFDFPEVSEAMFRLIDEFINTGVVEGIWRQSLDKLIQLLKLAGEWHLEGVIELGSDVVRRYVNRETAAGILNIAQTFVLPQLKEACCYVLNSMDLGVNFEGVGEADLAVTIEEFRDRTVPLLMEMASSITHVILTGRTGEAPEIKQVLPKCKRLVSFSVVNAKGCDPEIFGLLPRLRELRLKECPWMTDQIGKDILVRLSGFNILDLSENPQLGFQTFRAVSQQPLLETLCCVWCGGLEDGFLESIARGCPALHELRIGWCPKLTDVGMRALGTLRPTIDALDISNCIKISDVGIHDLLRPSQRLKSLSMQHLPSVSEAGIIQIPALSHTLRFLDITLCNISEAGVSRIRERYPLLQVVF